MTQRKLKLARGGNDFRVLMVVGSTIYSPGEMLAKAEVDDLIEHGNWHVTIVDHVDGMNLNETIKRLTQRVAELEKKK